MSDTRALMNTLSTALDHALNADERPKKIGFVLLVFPFDGPEGQRVNYASNGNRQDIVAALKEITARFEGQPHLAGRA